MLIASLSIYTVGCISFGAPLVPHSTPHLSFQRLVGYYRLKMPIHLGLQENRDFTILVRLGRLLAPDPRIGIVNFPPLKGYPQ